MCYAKVPSLSLKYLMPDEIIVFEELTKLS